MSLEPILEGAEIVEYRSQWREMLAASAAETRGITHLRSQFMYDQRMTQLITTEPMYPAENIYNRQDHHY